MKIFKLDNRFKLKKAGLATHMMATSMQAFDSIRKKLEEAYGPGRYVRYGDKYYHIPVNADWYYTHKKLGTHAGSTVYTTCIYLRREEQATFLTLAMAI